MALLFNQGDTSLSDILDGTKQLKKVSLSDQFHTVGNYFQYLNNNGHKEVPVTFEIGGMLESIVLTFRLAQAHYENTTVTTGTVTLQEDVGGTWTDRAVATFTSDEYLDFSEKRYNFQDIVHLTFDTPYMVDTTAGKWRFRFLNHRDSGTDTGYWYLGMVKNDAAHLETSLMMLPIMQETQVFDPATDVLFFRDTITSQDDTVDFEGVDITTFGFYATGTPASRLAIVPITTKLLEPSSTFHILKPTVPEVTIGMGGNFYLTSSYGKRTPSLQFGTEAEPITIDHRVNFLGYNHSASYKGLFNTQYTYGYGQHREIRAYGELGDYRTEMSEAHTKGDTEIKVKGDWSGWNVGDKIQTTFPRYTTTYSYNDHVRQEVKEITSISYDAGANVTTFGIDSALVYYYDLSSYGSRAGYGDEGITLTEADFPMYVYNISQSAPIHIGVKDGDYCQSATTSHKLDGYYYIKSVEFNHLEGVLWTDWYRTDFRGNLNKYRNKDDIENFLWKDVLCWNNYTNFYMSYITDAKLINVSAFKGTFGNWSTHINATRATRLHAKDGFAYGGNYPISTAYVSGAILENYITESAALHYNASGSNDTTLKNNYLRKGTYGVYYNGGASVTGYNNKWGFIDYRSSYGAGVVVPQGIIFVNTSITAPGTSNFYNDEVIYARSVARIAPDGSINAFFSNMTAQKILNGKLFTGGDELFSLGANTRLAFENYLGDGKYSYITENGVIEAEPDSTGGLQWGGITHNADFTISYKKNTVITSPNVPISVTAKIKIDNAGFYSGTHILPTLEIKGLGITQAQAKTQVLATTDWQFITVTGIPTSTGFMDIEITYQSDNADRKVIIDNIEVLPVEPRLTTDQDTTFRAGSVDTLIAEKITSFGVWAADKNINYGTNSMGQLQVNTFKKTKQLFINTNK